MQNSHNFYVIHMLEYFLDILLFDSVTIRSPIIQRVVTKMLKSELVDILKKRLPTINERDVELALNCILELMSETLETGGSIEIRHFGSFSTRTRAARTARNPKTGDTLTVTARSRVHFKPGLELRKRVNDSRDQCSIRD